MRTPKRTYGAGLSSAYRHGFHHVTVNLLVREDDAAHPINPRNDGESAIYDAPKHLDGLMLDGFGMDGFVSDSSHDFICYEPSFSSKTRADERDLRMMLATCRRVNRAIGKADAHEAGDVFMAMASALRLEWAAWAGGRYNYYSDAQWTWASIGEGRTHYRRLIVEARNAALAKAGKPPLAA